MSRLCVTTKNCVYEGRVIQAGVNVRVRNTRAIPSHFKVLDATATEPPPERTFPRCIILGDGPSRDDAQRFALFHAHHADVHAVNRAGIRYPGELTAWCSRHGNLFSEWSHAREAQGFAHARMVSDQEFSYPAVTHYPNGPGGGSGEYALGYALFMGYERIVLAGFDLSGGKGGNGYAQFVTGFIAQKCDAVRALHGLTRDIFGEPTDEWFLNIQGE